eukprot:Nk52_evm48s2391 gene=Nk52_evmTU48s2391
MKPTRRSSRRTVSVQHQQKSTVGQKSTNTSKRKPSKGAISNNRNSVASAVTAQVPTRTSIRASSRNQQQGQGKAGTGTGLRSGKAASRDSSLASRNSASGATSAASASLYSSSGASQYPVFNNTASSLHGQYHSGRKRPRSPVKAEHLPPGVSKSTRARIQKGIEKFEAELDALFTGGISKTVPLAPNSASVASATGASASSSCLLSATAFTAYQTKAQDSGSAFLVDSQASSSVYSLPGIPERSCVFPSYFTAFREVVDITDNFLPPLPRFLVPVEARPKPPSVEGGKLECKDKGSERPTSGPKKVDSPRKAKHNVKHHVALYSPQKVLNRQLTEIPAGKDEIVDPYHRGLSLRSPPPSVSPSPVPGSKQFPTSVEHLSSTSEHRLFAEANNDNCETCGGTGELLCCDNCPCSFHFLCCEAPEAPESITSGEWLCNKCRSLKKTKEFETLSTSFEGRLKKAGSLVFEAGTGILNALKRNPVEFSLPDSLVEKACLDLAVKQRKPQSMSGDNLNEKEAVCINSLLDSFEKMRRSTRNLARVGSGNNGGNSGGADQSSGGSNGVGNKPLTNGANNTNGTSGSMLNLSGIGPLNGKKSGGQKKIILCFNCQEGTSMDPNHLPLQGKRLVECSFCPLVYHLDCLDPPMTVPTKSKEWMCPNHYQHKLPDYYRRTRFSLRSQLTQSACNVPNHIIKLNFVKKVRAMNEEDVNNREGSEECVSNNTSIKRKAEQTVEQISEEQKLWLEELQSFREEMGKELRDGNPGALKRLRSAGTLGACETKFDYIVKASDSHFSNTPARREKEKQESEANNAKLDNALANRDSERSSASWKEYASDWSVCISESMLNENEMAIKKPHAILQVIRGPCSHLRHLVYPIFNEFSVTVGTSNCVESQLDKNDSALLKGSSRSYIDLAECCLSCSRDRTTNECLTPVPGISRKHFSIVYSDREQSYLLINYCEYGTKINGNILVTVGNENCRKASKLDGPPSSNDFGKERGVIEAARLNDVNVETASSPFPLPSTCVIELGEYSLVWNTL